MRCHRSFARSLAAVNAALPFGAALCFATAFAAGCSERAQSGGGIVTVDGSSTVYPISEAVAEELGKTSKLKVTIGVSGTGGGFKKLCSGVVAIADASRPIKSSEAAACAAARIEPIELPIAYDGIAIVVHPDNTWATSMTVGELKRLWAPEAQGKVTKWSDVRQGWPAEEIHLFGAGVDSGTYDYFTQAIVGTEHSSRGDFTSSEDDNVLVQGVSTDRLALGFFGLAYYEHNASKLKIVPVDDGDASNGDGPIAASPAAVHDGRYQPLARPLFLYVAKQAASQPEVQAFIDTYLAEAPRLVSEVGYVALAPEAYALVRARFVARTVGSVFATAPHNARVVDVLRGGVAPASAAP